MSPKAEGGFVDFYKSSRGLRGHLITNFPTSHKWIPSIWLPVIFLRSLSEQQKLNPFSFSKNIVVYFCKCNLIGYATCYLFVNTYRVAASDKAEFFAKLTIFIPIKFVFTKIISLLALNFYEAIVTRASPYLIITSQKFRARNLIVKQSSKTH